MIDHAAELREQVVQLRAIAARQELILGLEEFRGLDPAHRRFVEFAIRMTRLSATALDQSLELQRELMAALGYHSPPPRPRLEVVHDEPAAS